jgi:hypothetical protein
MQTPPHEPGPLTEGPFHGPTINSGPASHTAATRCPVSAEAAAFDVFDGPWYGRAWNAPGCFRPA